MDTNLYQYTLRLADNAVILGQRLSEWCGHGPVLEQDLAMANIALDLIGQARALYQYAAEIEGLGRSEDDLVASRDAWDYYNLLLLEQPNGDFAHTVLRHFFYSAYALPYYRALTKSTDAQLAAIAQKALKETTYHLRWSSEWVVRLGDGTAESARRMNEAIDDLWMYTGEMFVADDLDMQMHAQGIAPNPATFQKEWQESVAETFAEANLQVPTATFVQKGGKQGQHTEHLGYILADLQFMQRAYPNSEW